MSGAFRCAQQSNDSALWETCLAWTLHAAALGGVVIKAGFMTSRSASSNVDAYFVRSALQDVALTAFANMPVNALFWEYLQAILPAARCRR